MGFSLRAVAFAVYALLAPCAVAAVSPPTFTPEPGSERAALRALENALARIRNGDLAGARDLLTQLIDTPGFARLSGRQQQQALSAAGFAMLNLGDAPAALVYLRRSSDSQYSTGADWLSRFAAASISRDIPDAVKSLTTLARRWPGALTRLKDESIFRLAAEAKKQPGIDPGYMEMVNALFDAGWKTSLGLEPAALWRDLAPFLIEKNEIKRAGEVAKRIAEPRALIRMRADHRFAPLLEAGSLLDPDAAALRQVEGRRQAAVDAPRSLKLHVQWTSSLLLLNRFQDALAAADQVIQSARSDLEKPAYDDVREYLIWVMNNRARALMGLGRWDEAARQLESAARRPENGDINVSQAINLAFYYCDLGRPADALAAIEELGSTSSYGRMQLASVRLCAAAQTGNAAAAEQALAYLSEHRADAMETFQIALVMVGQSDEAAKLLIGRLQDPSLRPEALGEIQQYEIGAMPPKALERYRRWQDLIGRADVQSAARAVGTIRHFSIAPPNF